MADFEAELMALASSSASETATPHIKGVDTLAELTSKKPSLARSTTENIKNEFDQLSPGKSVVDSKVEPVEESAKLHQICFIEDITRSWVLKENHNVNELCRQKRAGGKNTFCIKFNCTTEHRNNNSPPVSLNREDIVVLKAPDIAFLDPIGSSRKVSTDLKAEWLSSSKTISEWGKLFLMTDINDGKASVSDINDLKSFSKMASNYRTPSKPPKFESTVESFESKHEWKNWEKEVLAGRKSLDLSGSNFSQSVESQFKALEKLIKEVVNQVNKNNTDLSKSISMLEFERDNIKLEIGNRDSVNIHSDFESLSIWSTIGELSDSLIQPQKDIRSPTATSSDVLKIITDKIKEYSNSMASKQELEKQCDSLKGVVVSQQREINDLKIMMTAMENRLNLIENKWVNDYPPRVIDVVQSLNSGQSVSELTKSLNELKKELDDIKPSKSDRSFKFQGLTIGNLKEMNSWLATNVPNMNYALIVDLHCIFEHINHQINPSKTTLDFLQAIFKLEIPTPNHAVSIQSFDGPLPKFFCKTKDHKVTKLDDSMLDNIKTFDDWDNPNYGYRQRLAEELNNAERNIENAIDNELSLSEQGRAITTTALKTTCGFVNELVRYIDSTFKELRRSKYTEKRAWHLVTSLVCRIFSDVFVHRVGKMGIMKAKDPSQVAVTVYHSCFMSLKVMQEYRDYKIEKHPSIASEYIKFICHNSPFETLELFEKRINSVETSIKDFSQKQTSRDKQLNTTTQKADDGKTKLGNLESRIAKLEKK